MKNTENTNPSINRLEKDEKTECNMEVLRKNSRSVSPENGSNQTISNKRSSKKTIRIDELLHQLYPDISLEKCRKLIMAGQIRSDSQPVDKPGSNVKPSSVIEIIGIKKYVSRPGFKLEGA